MMGDESVSGELKQDPADLIFFGGDIITVDDAKPFAEALAVRNGRIISVGTENELFQLKGDTTRIVNLEGNTLLPGLIEPHSHPIASALFYDWIDVSGFNNKDVGAVLDKLKDAVKKSQPGEWITAFGYDPILTKGLKTLNADLLSEIAPDNPVFIMTQTMHTSYVNYKAFEVAGINKGTPQPGRGSYYVKDENGELTGMLIEAAAFFLFFLTMPQKTLTENRQLLVNQMHRYANAGYTTVGAAGYFPLFPDAVETLREIVESDSSLVRICAYTKEEEFNAGFAEKPFAGNDRYRFVGAKFWYDGSPYTGTMLLSQPYLDSDLMQQSLGIESGTCGHRILAREQLRDLIQKHHDDGWQVAVHAQGDQAVIEVLDVYQEVLKNTPRTDHRHRIEHCGLFPKDQLKRAFELGVVPSWHINHIHYYGEALRDEILGSERSEVFMPIATSEKEGLRNSLHNDSPMYPAEPMKLLRTAVTRMTRNNEIIGKKEAISVESGIKALTIDAAWQMFMEDRIGSLEVGKLADLTILGENPLQCNPEHLDKIKIIETYREGRIV